MGCSPRGHKELDTTEATALIYAPIYHVRDTCSLLVTFFLIIHILDHFKLVPQMLHPDFNII